MDPKECTKSKIIATAMVGEFDSCCRQDRFTFTRLSHCTSAAFRPSAVAAAAPKIAWREAFAKVGGIESHDAHLPLPILAASPTFGE